MRTTNVLLSMMLLSLLFGMWSCTKQEDNSACENNPFSETVDSNRVYIPNAFTPNGDGTNDIFRPVLTSLKAPVWGNGQYVEHPVPTITFFQIKAWDTGTVIFDGATNSFEGWNGAMGIKPNNDSYQYVINIRTPEGTYKSYEGRVYRLLKTKDNYQNACNCKYESTELSGTTDPLIGC